MDIYNPDKTITPPDLESLALEYLGVLPIPGVEGRTLDPDDGWATVLHAAVEQTSIHDICDQTTDTPCSDRVLEWLETVDHDQFEQAVNDALTRQARQMLLGVALRSICLDFVDIHYHGRYHRTKAELCKTTPRDGTTTCHRYCAAFVLCRGKPLILAFTWMHGDESKADAAERVLGRVVDLGLTIECLLADRAFASAAGIDTMQTTAPMIAPLIRRGKELAKLLDTQVSYWSEYAMYEGTAREVRFPLAICVSYQESGARTGCWSARTRRASRSLARQNRSNGPTGDAQRSKQASERSGKHSQRPRRVIQVFAWCTSVAFLLRNLWILVGWAMLAQPRRGGRARPIWFPFKRFRKCIGHALDERLGWIWEIPTNGVGVPMSHRAAVAG